MLYIFLIRGPRQRRDIATFKAIKNLIRQRRPLLGYTPAKGLYSRYRARVFDAAFQGGH